MATEIAKAVCVHSGRDVFPDAWVYEVLVEDPSKRNNPIEAPTNQWKCQCLDNLIELQAARLQVNSTVSNGPTTQLNCKWQAYDAIELLATYDTIRLNRKSATYNSIEL